MPPNSRYPATDDGRTALKVPEHTLDLFYGTAEVFSNLGRLPRTRDRTRADCGCPGAPRRDDGQHIWLSSDWVAALNPSDYSEPPTVAYSP
jgi:hypothetical protein